MKLTKEECIEYLETLKNFACLNATCCMQTIEEIKQNKKLFNECINYFEQLIKEHFDSSPLKFEELEEGMGVWDSKDKRYLKIYTTECLSGIDFVHENAGDLLTRAIRFEVNRFYRHEV